MPRTDENTLMFELRFFFLVSSFLGVLLNVARQCFAQNDADHCPMFYMILGGSFQPELFYDSIPGIPQAELSS